MGHVGTSQRHTLSVRLPALKSLSVPLWQRREFPYPPFIMDTLTHSITVTVVLGTNTMSIPLWQRREFPYPPFIMDSLTHSITVTVVLGTNTMSIPLWQRLTVVLEYNTSHYDFVNVMPQQALLAIKHNSFVLVGYQVRFLVHS